jgi:hypothetical protein
MQWSAITSCHAACGAVNWLLVVPLPCCPPTEHLNILIVFEHCDEQTEFRVFVPHPQAPGQGCTSDATHVHLLVEGVRGCWDALWKGYKSRPRALALRNHSPTHRPWLPPHSLSSSLRSVSACAASQLGGWPSLSTTLPTTHYPPPTPLTPASVVQALPQLDPYDPDSFTDPNSPDYPLSWRPCGYPEDKARGRISCDFECVDTNVTNHHCGDCFDFVSSKGGTSSETGSYV